MQGSYKALIVDDEETTRLYLGELLNIYFPHIQYSFAENGEDALFAISKNHYELIFLDITMPGMDGVELLQLIREKNLDVPVIFISAHANFVYAQHGIRLGVHDYLLKPVSPLELKKCILHLEDIMNEQKPVSQDQIKFPSPLGYILLNVDDLFLIEKIGRNKLNLYTESGDIYKHISYSMKELESKLPDNFIRITRQLLANKKNIKSFSTKDNTIVLSDNESSFTINCSRKVISKLSNRL